MSTEHLVTFRQFRDVAHLEEFKHLLQRHEIPFYVDDNKPRFDAFFAYNDAIRIYSIKVRKEDLELATEISQEVDRQLLDEIPGDYYLFGFTEDELRDVVVKFDEWNDFDVMLAKKLLSEKGVDIDEKEIKWQRERKKDLLSQPDSESVGPLVIIGYILSVLIPPLGLIIALILLSAKKTTPEGRRFYFTETSRWHAGVMIIIFVAHLILFTLLTLPYY